MSAYRYFKATYWRTIDEFCQGCSDNEFLCEAVVKVDISGAEKGEKFVAAKGRDPVDALNKALHEALDSFFPCLEGIEMVRWRARDMDKVDENSATLEIKKPTVFKKMVEVSATFRKGEEVWVVRSTSASRTEASFLALVEGFQVAIAKSLSV